MRAAQILAVHCTINGHYYHPSMVVMENRQTPLYTAVFQRVWQLAGRLQPDNIVTDYEPEHAQSLREVSGIPTAGYYLYYCQGPGTWSILNVQECANDAQMPWRVRVRRHKLNRTHDAFNGNVSLLDDLDDSYGGRIEICKVVFGGCKPFSTRKTDCLAETIKKYGEESAERAFAFVGIDPPTFPIPKGDYSAHNYIANMSNVLKEGVYGEFKADCLIVKDEQDVACLQFYVKYEPVNYYDE